MRYFRKRPESHSREGGALETSTENFFFFMKENDRSIIVLVNEKIERIILDFRGRMFCRIYTQTRRDP